MGFSNGDNTPVTFAALNAKVGKFVVRGRETEGGPYVKLGEYSQLRDVRLSRIEMKDDEYEGNPFKKVRMTLEGDRRYIVEVNAGTFAAGRMMAAWLRADLTAEVGLTVRLQTAGSTYKRKDGTFSQPLASDICSVSLFQAGHYIQLNGADMPPKAVMVKVGSKEVADTSARDAFVEQAVARVAGMLSALPPVPGAAPDLAQPSASQRDPAWPQDGDPAPPQEGKVRSFADMDDDIPFD